MTTLAESTPKWKFKQYLSPSQLAVMPHGLYTTFNRGCICDPCRQSYNRWRAELRAIKATQPA